jgi:DNA-binding CsgD family transcriptional regulator
MYGTWESAARVGRGKVAPATAAARHLIGRAAELDLLVGAVERARERGGALVVHGEHGIGKTSLLREAGRRLSERGFRVLSTVGMESEANLAGSALHQLLVPLMGAGNRFPLGERGAQITTLRTVPEPTSDHLGGLPGPQRDTLETAFGLSEGATPDRFLLGLAVLSLLTDGAAERPLLCIVDDAQWLDEMSAQVLAFVSRRLPSEPLAIVFAVREPNERRELTSLPELWLDGLKVADARALFTSALAGQTDPEVRDRIIIETHGNPLALLESARGSTPDELAGGFAPPRATALPESIEREFHRRLDVLPIDTRRFVLLAAADPVGEPTLIWRGAEQLGIAPEAAAPAAEAGLLEFGTNVRFRHPLLRSAAYRSASLQERCVVHGALAEATDPALDPDRRAWHLSQATIAPDERVASALERSAARAQRRGGLAAAAAFRERAAVLTPERAARTTRLLEAARAKRAAGALDAARQLVSMVDTEALDELDRARLDTLQGQIAFDQRQGPEASRVLAEAARRLEPLDLGLARTTHLEALGAAMWVGDRDVPGGMLSVARAAVQAPHPGVSPQAIDVLLDGFAGLLADGYRAAAGPLSRALELVLAAKAPTDDRTHWLQLTTGGSVDTVARELWDADAWHTVASRREQFARDTGALVQLQFALHKLAWSHILSGRLNEAALLVEEDRTLAAATGNPALPYGEMLLAAFRGEARASELIDTATQEAARQGLGRVVIFTKYARAVLSNGRGDSVAARDAVQSAFEHDHPGYGPFIVPELVEAAARTEDTALLSSALTWISDRTRATPTDWSLGIEARIRALLSDGADADAFYERSIEHLRRTRVRTELARAHLLYGEWLRRRQRRVDAREQLSAALDMLETMGMAAFAARARRELSATGATVRRRTAETRDSLTPQERQIAHLARDGLSNPQIGAHLFLSPRTVEWHLRKVFGKLGIGSRRELHRALPKVDPAAA